MSRRLAPVLLGWYFVVSYGQTNTPGFFTQTACEAARTETVRQLKLISNAIAQRISPKCVEDPAPPLRMTLDGALTLDGTLTPPAP